MPGCARAHARGVGEHIPERERRCIFDDALVGDDFGAAMALSDGVADDMSDGDGIFNGAFFFPSLCAADHVRYK